MTFAVEELDAKRHDRANFDCSEEPLNRYLKTLAAQYRSKGIATTFVLVDSERPSLILGYYSLSAASLAFERLTEADRKGLPAYPVPAVRIGRLATSISIRGQRLGELLLQNAIKRTLQARNLLGVHAVVVNAKSAAAEGFYRKYGFRLCDSKNRQLYLPLGAE
ncbi:MAG TPA: GNAT family N-acetyltransferase [Steroidobacteraceae bacterium]|jgi:ribosomal protein S18 acetylase RimI-like enzyme|nr:GNAT family N-acetyltransferase [Steroidobacteraceae bacterium]